MNHVIRHIEYLVYRHDCVVLPKWGAFIANYQSACYDEALGLMYPPRRELSFCASVDYNDGLLASSIARKEAVSFAKASRMVEDELSSMKHQLELDGEVMLGNVGRFIKQDEVSVIFEPARKQSNIGTAGFETFSIKPLRDKVKEEAISIGRIEPSRRGRLSRLGLRAIKAAAAIAVVVGMSLVLLRPSFNRNDDMASIAPVMSQKSSQSSIVPSMGEEMTLNIRVPQKDNMAVAPVSPIVADETTENFDDKNLADVRHVNTDRYCLVIASFPSINLADKFILENKPMQLGILVKDGKYRVYAATGNTTKETAKAKESAEIGSRFADAWVCSMR